MKHLLIFAIIFYKKLMSPLLDMVFGPGRGCRFEETCSRYSIRAILSYGVLKGGFLSIVRILHCQPFSSRSLKYEPI